MSLFSLEIESYRAFRDKTQISFRPLTLLYGHNQAGKSTLLRLLPFLAESIFGSQGPLALSSPAVPTRQFKELGWLGLSPSFTPKIKLSIDHPHNLSMGMHFADENGLIVNRLNLAEKNDEKFSADWTATKSRNGAKLSGAYEGRFRGANWKGDLNFESLFPTGLPAQAQDIAQAIKQACTSLDKIQWLRANRIDGSSSTPQTVRCCSPDGSDLGTLIRGEHEQKILEIVSNWLQRQEGLGNEVKIDRSGQFIIGADGRETLPLYLSGEGLRSLLPILLCAAWSETKSANAPTMLAIEEPESHLHPHLQVALFDHLLDLVKLGIPVILETHSVYLLRAMQLAVLEERILPEDVGLYWVGQATDGSAGIQSIDVQTNATLQNWRPNVFEKEQELARRIMELRWQKGDVK